MTATFVEIPLIPNRNQKLKVTLGGVLYGLSLNWNQIGPCWILDFYDSDNNPLLRGMPLVSGGNLLEQYAYLTLGTNAAMEVLTLGPGHSPDEVPTFTNLGIDGHVYYINWTP